MYRIIPFLNHSEHFRHTKKAIIFKALELLKDLVGSELSHRINQLTRIGILPKAATRYFNLITQQYSGHVTIFPKTSINDYLTILDNPKVEFIRKGLVDGSRRTYPSNFFTNIKKVLNTIFLEVNHIAAILVVEKALEKNYLFVRTTSEKKIFLDEIDEADLDVKL